MSGWETLPWRLRALAWRARFPLYSAPRRSIARAETLDPAARSTSSEDPSNFELDDLDLLEKRADDRFLGIYTPEGLRRALEVHGLLAALARRGFTAPRIELELSDPTAQRVRVFDGSPARLLAELVASRSLVTELGPVRFRRPRELAKIEWLTLSDPDAKEGSALLPGQQRPGLGLLREVISMGLAGAMHHGWAGLLVVPAHYHLAWLYHPWFRPLDPTDEGRLLALRSYTRGRNLAEASWAIERGHLRSGGNVWRWRGFPMLAPTTPILGRYLRSWRYARIAVETAAENSFTLCG